MILVGVLRELLGLTVPRFMSAEQAAEYVRREYPSMLKAIREDVLGARNDLAYKLLELTLSEKQVARAYAELLREARIDL